jgi:ABC-type sugar transport system ATPase subunit
MAIARALVKDAQLLLLDEPLVNLDYKLREELQTELQEIFRQRDAMVVYTTTEPGEALKFGGRIVVLDGGRVIQTGPITQVYRNPANLKVAEVFSDPPINYLDCRVDANTLTVIDPNLKWQLRCKLKEIHEQLKLTFIYVTHDQVEALTFADKVIVMYEGEIVQIGTPQELFDNPVHTLWAISSAVPE